MTDHCQSRRGLRVLLLAASLSAPAANADNEAAYRDWAAGRHDQALAEWRRLAEDGDTVAQYNVGSHYLTGDGLPQNRSLALDWLRRAATGGSLRAMELLGTLLMSGNGFTPDYGEAAAWLNKAAQAGSALAANNLAVFYLEGRGAPVDLPRAWRYAQSAAQGGIDTAAMRAEIEKHMTPGELAGINRAPPPPPSTPPAKPEPAAARKAADWLVHLASVNRRAEAETEWQRLQRQTPELRQFEPIFAEVSLTASRSVTRIFIDGFADRDTARAFCEQLRRRAYCLVTRNRDFK